MAEEKEELTEAEANKQFKEKATQNLMEYIKESGLEEYVEALLTLKTDKFDIVNTPDENGVTPLAHAAIAGKENIVKLLLEKEAMLDLPDKDDRTPLAHAAIAGKENIVKLLLEKEAVLDWPDTNGRTPLAHAAIAGKENIVQLLLAKGAMLDLPDTDGRTPLAHAVLAGKENIVQLLLAKGAMLDLPDKDGFTPLARALYLERTDIVELLVRKGANVNFQMPDGDTPLITAVRSGDLELVKMMTLQAGLEGLEARDKEGNIPIMIAAERGDVQMTKYLLSRNSPLLGVKSPPKNQEGETALTLAAKNGHTEVVKVLVGTKEEQKSGNTANPNELGKDGKTALIHAVENGNLGMVQALLNAKETLEVNMSLYRENTQNTIPLIVASKNGFKYIVDALIKAGANVNVRDEKGQTALMHAAKKGDVDTMNTIIQNAGKDKNKLLNESDMSGKTPLIHALETGGKKAANTLINAGADVNFRGKDMTGEPELDDNGDSKYKMQKHPLSVAIEKGVDAEIIKALIEKGADINAKDANGKTPLMIAVEAGNYDAIGLLLDKGADINAQDDNGKTALMIAAEKSDFITITTLLGRKDRAGNPLVDINAKDNQGNTALDYAKDNNPLAEELRNNGAVNGQSSVKSGAENNTTQPEQLKKSNGIVMRAFRKMKKRFSAFLSALPSPNASKNNQKNPRRVQP